MDNMEELGQTSNDTSLPYSVKQDSDVYKKIFTSFGYNELDDSSQKEVDACVDDFLSTGLTPKLNKTSINVMFDLQSIERAEVLALAKDWLEDMIPEEIYLETDKTKLQFVHKELRFHLYHYLSRYSAIRYHTDTIQSQTTELAACYRYIKLCSELLHECERAQIDLEEDETKEDKQIELNDKHKTLVKKIDALKPDRDSYLPSFLDRDEDCQDSDYLLGQLRRVNNVRLVWLWDRIIIELFISSAQAILAESTAIALHISWSLYLFLATIHLTGAFWHAFDSLTSEEERMIDKNKRIIAQLKLRVYRIINDLIWGLANLACCFWLYGQGTFGFIGDLVTGLLLCMDLTVACVYFAEETKRDELKIKLYQEKLETIIDDMCRLKDEFDITSLLNEIKEKTQANIDITSLLDVIENKLSNSENEQLKALFWLLKLNYQGKTACQAKWNEQFKYHVNDIVYCFVLLISFSVLCGFYLSILPISLPVTMVVAGAILLGASTLVWQSASAIMGCYDLKQKSLAAKNEYNKLFEKFSKKLKSADLNNTKDSKQLKQLYLKILQKSADFGQVEDELLLKQAESVRVFLSQTLIPTAIVLTLLFAPAMTVGLPTYVFLMIGILVATFIVTSAIKSYFRVQDTAWEYSEEAKDDDGLEESLIATKTRSKPSVIDQDFEAFCKLARGSREETSLRVLSEVRSHRTGNNRDLFGNLVKEMFSSSATDDNPEGEDLLPTAD